MYKCKEYYVNFQDMFRIVRVIKNPHEAGLKFRKNFLI